MCARHRGVLVQPVRALDYRTRVLVLGLDGSLPHLQKQAPLSSDMTRYSSIGACITTTIQLKSDDSLPEAPNF